MFIASARLLKIAQVDTIQYTPVVKSVFLTFESYL